MCPGGKNYTQTVFNFSPAESPPPCTGLLPRFPWVMSVSQGSTAPVGWLPKTSAPPPCNESYLEALGLEMLKGKMFPRAGKVRGVRTLLAQGSAPTAGSGFHRPSLGLGVLPVQGTPYEHPLYVSGRHWLRVSLGWGSSRK